MYFTFKSLEQVRDSFDGYYAAKWLDEKKLAIEDATEQLKQEIERLKEKSELKSILEKIESHTIYSVGEGFVCASGSLRTDFVFPENVAQYVDDILGGKVIKQEATKAIKIDKNGNVTTGLTKQSPDTEYTYKLIRE